MPTEPRRDPRETNDDLEFPHQRESRRQLPGKSGQPAPSKTGNGGFDPVDPDEDEPSPDDIGDAN